MRPVLVYTASRLALFAITAGVLYLLDIGGLVGRAIGMPDLLALLLLSFLVSGLASYVLLSKQRDAMSMAIASRAENNRRLMAERAAREDAEEAAQAEEAARQGASAQATPAQPGSRPASPGAADADEAPKRDGDAGK
ncbi:DUF4229 domain-containing protein [Bailinhaonella thermotolerans]|uniref:DUF4229 domain-containing protein n=1 Tax=Bailinhaonella thermotolerans TaxID=1070861 RepID=A0A3A4A8M9_9ACTN|nr:DUF4229 domain-containing protein [Bailinhaonella thermotolerans]RJL22509.1 DUF4229 domain-containing protein [Bailinhaonella thermotolerans]